MKRVVRWIGAAILALSVLTMLLADMVLAATAARAQAVRVTLLEKGPVHGLVAGIGGDYAPAVVGEAVPVLLVPAAGGPSGRRAAIGLMTAFCARQGRDTATADAWADEYIHFDAANGAYHFPDPCGQGL